MDSLEYSNDALEVRSLFHNCDFTVYVEGEDDVIFWDNIFKLSNKNAYIEEVGGIEELKKIIKKIEDEDVDIYVARDNDYNDFTDSISKNKRIFYTYGHSIENTLYNICTIKKVIKNYSRSNNTELLNEINEQLENNLIDFENKIKPLLVYEIANDIYQKGISILGTNCCKFLVNNNSTILCETKINNFIESKRNLFLEEEISNIQTKLNDSTKRVWYIIRGHFLTNFVVNLIKNFSKKITKKTVILPNDALYPLFIDGDNLSQSNDINHYLIA